MNAEIITTGTEILLGEIVDTNSAYLAQQLAQVGLDLYYVTTVGDNENRIASAIRAAMRRSNVVITTGGLGPTIDDVTRQAVARATDRKLLLNPDLLAQIECFFERRGRTMGENNRRQAYVPEDALVIENPVGTAPAFIVETDSAIVITLPGVPHEMQYLTETRILPYLREKLGLRAFIRSRILRTCGIGESSIDELIGDLMLGSNPTVGLAAHPGQTDIRITVKASEESEAETLVAQVEGEIRARLGDVVYGTGNQTLEEVVVGLLIQEARTVALAETSGGLVTQRLTSVPGSSEVLLGATLAPDRSSLLERLCHHADARGEAYSPPQTTSMPALVANAVRDLYQADYGLAIVGPDDELPDQQARLVATVALAGFGSLAERTISFGVRTPSVAGWRANAALDMLRRHLLRLPQPS